MITEKKTDSLSPAVTGCHQALGRAPEVAAGLLPELDRLAGPWRCNFCDVLDTKKQREGQEIAVQGIRSGEIGLRESRSPDMNCKAWAK